MLLISLDVLCNRKECHDTMWGGEFRPFLLGRYAERQGAVMNQKCHPLLLPLIPVVQMLDRTLGIDYEIVLHDVSGPKHKIVAIAHGELTGRTEQSPLTEFGTSLRENDEYKDVDFIANYPSSASDGRPMRSSVTLIRDKRNKVVGLFCINYDMTRARMLKNLSEELTRIVPLSSSSGASVETLVPTSDSLLKKMIDETRAQRGGRPLRYTTKQEKLEIVQSLEEKGFFRLKRAVDTLCKELGKSRFTIYGYLREIRKSK